MIEKVNFNEEAFIEEAKDWSIGDEQNIQKALQIANQLPAETSDAVRNVLGQYILDTYLHQNENPELENQCFEELKKLDPKDLCLRFSKNNPKFVNLNNLDKTSWKIETHSIGDAEIDEIIQHFPRIQALSFSGYP